MITHGVCEPETSYAVRGYVQWQVEYIATTSVDSMNKVGFTILQLSH